ncbi:MAG TPA: TonB-dependent receptor [Melioribacteraceae bacterium]|nr:TonB-dependent receptor [Melioribacteraceae bacterium]
MKKLIILFLFITVPLLAQIKELGGRVLNYYDREPIPLVNIIIKGTSIGTSTNENGEFVLIGDLTPDAILTFSHIAFKSFQISVSEYLQGNKIILLNSNIISSQTVLVQGSIAKEGITPVTFSKIDRKELERSYTNQDIPEILSYLPSVMFYSENGNGLGYNYLSIRGFDQRRISVAINGIPQNDPEDHNVYWLDFPDLLESTEIIQVQRGAGSGITGYPSIGGSINIITSAFSDKPRMEFTASIGDYNTRKYGLTYSSGLVGKKYSFYTNLSKTLSSGYRNLSWIDFNAFHLSAVRYDEKLTSQINIYGGPIADGLAYNGLPKFAVNNPDLRKENLSYWEADQNGYTYKALRRPDEIENFSQSHFELLNEYRMSDRVIFNSALFAVLGDGFFDYDGSWGDTTYFRLTSQNGFMPLTNPSNVLIRAMVENKQFGWIPRISISHQSGELILGGEIRKHQSVHWGSLNYGENLPAGITKDFRYYYYEGGKDIVNFFLNENYSLNERINLLAELQFAYHKYSIKNEKYLNNEFEIDGIFLNPRVGINYRINEDHNIYFSYANVTREPRLKNYYDAAESSGGAVPQFEITPGGRYDFSNPLVKPEQMNNYELGTFINGTDLSGSVNLYYMIFNDEIVKNGKLDRFGQPVTGNMNKTIHYGIEGSLGYKLNQSFDLVLNGSFGKNYISNGFTFYDDGSPVPLKVDLSGNRISGFPDVTFNAIINYHYNNFYAKLTAKYVGEFYTDNYDNNLTRYLNLYPGLTDYTDNKVDSYLVLNFYSSYELNPDPVMESIKIFIQVNNLFNNLFASYGIGKEYFPAAERNLLIGMRIGL